MAERERANLREASSRLGGLEEHKALSLTCVGRGLSCRLAYFPPVLRRATYGLLGLRASVEPGGRVCIEGVLDAGVVHLSRDVEGYVAALEEAGSRPVGRRFRPHRSREVRGGPPPNREWGVRRHL